MLPGPYIFERGLALLADIEDLRRLGLHPVGDFHRRDGRFELRIGRRAALHLVELVEQIDLPPLLGEREVLVVDEGHQLLRIEFLADDLVGPLRPSAMNVPWCTAGRNALFQSGGPTVDGILGHSTT